jgi:hypothetical protein
VFDHVLLAVSTLAALGALYFAWLTVTDAEIFHAKQETDRKRLRLEGVESALTGVAETASLNAAGYPHDVPVMPSRLLLLRAALASVDTELEAVRKVAGHAGEERFGTQECEIIASECLEAFEELHGAISALASTG